MSFVMSAKTNIRLTTITKAFFVCPMLTPPPKAMQTIKEDLIPSIITASEWPESTHRTRVLTFCLHNLKKFVDENYTRPEGMYSKVRRLITDGLFEWDDKRNDEVIKLARGIVRQNQADFRATQAKARAVVDHKNSHQTVLSMVYVQEVVTRLKASEIFSDNVVLLMLSSGARKIEILDKGTSEFFGHDSMPGRITQAGVAKRRDEEGLPITKPLLFLKPQDFLRRLSRVREEVEERQKEGRVAIGKSFSHQLENLCQQLWPQHVENGYRTGTHINRAIYANVAYKKFGSPSESLTHFIKKKLGHDTMGSAANYMNVSIAFDEESALAEEAAIQAVAVEPHRVALEDEQGYLHEFTREPTRRMDKEDREELAKRFAKQMRIAGVPVNRRNLLELGIQSKIVTSSEVLLEH